MALLADQSADVNSNLTTGAGTQSVVYTVPGNVPVKVESVVATITNAAGAAVTPELTIRDQSGVVIARKAQRLTIPAGDSGTATFALRLDDDVATTSTATVSELTLALGPYAFWKLNEAGGVTAYDSSGNGHDLTSGGATNPPTWLQPAGPPGDPTALWVDTFTREGGTLADFTDNFTVGVWANLGTNPPTLANLIGQTGGGGAWQLYADGFGSAALEKFGLLVNGNPLRADNVFALNTWYFLAAVRDAGTWRLYVNGQVQSATIAFTPPAGIGTNTWLGNNAPNPGVTPDPFHLVNGLLSYAFIVNSVVSASDLLAIYTAGL